MERAKEIFLKYNGNHFFMDHNGEGDEYDSYHISKETEEIWAKECISNFMTSKLNGKEAFRTYSAVTELLSGNKRDENWEKCLYYPLKSKYLDDVTVLYMLPCGFRMAERAVKKHTFSRKEADAYLQVLDGFIRQVQVRVEEGTITRSTDYGVYEFSDPVYVASYLDKLKKKWVGLFQ